MRREKYNHYLVLSKIEVDFLHGFQVVEQGNCFGQMEYETMYEQYMLCYHVDI